MKCIPKSQREGWWRQDGRGWCDSLGPVARRGVSTHALHIDTACRGGGVDAVFKDHPPKGRPGRTARGKSLRPQPLAPAWVRGKDPPRRRCRHQSFSPNASTVYVINPWPATALHLHCTGVCYARATKTTAAHDRRKFLNKSHRLQYAHDTEYLQVSTYIPAVSAPINTRWQSQLIFLF